MREAAALLRASWLTAMSYRLNSLLSLGAVVLSAVPIYFMAGALQPVIGPKLETHGDHFFAFLIIGLIAQAAMTAAINALPQALTSSISTGTLEALLTTPASWPTLFVGLSLYTFAWTAARVAVMLAVGLALGVHVAWGHSLAAVGILGLIVAAYVPFGLLSAASVLAFRTQGPFTPVAMLLSAFLGGLYYPTDIIPSWLRDVSEFVPLTYGLRALRRVILEGWPLGAVAGDLAVVAAFAAALLTLGMLAFAAALRYARRAGTLGQY